MQREVVKISELKAAPYNPRTISKEAAEGLTQSLKRWGVVQEVVANRRTGYIVGGHQRVAALRKMGVKEVPVVWVDLDDVEEKALNVALNNPHIAGEFDDTIAGLLTEIRDGIGPDDFEALMLDDLLPPDATVVEGNTDPDDVPEAPEEPITKPGDLWILGEHRLLCGDSTNVQHVERLMGGEKADMVFTDPPYDLPDDVEFQQTIQLAVSNGHVFVMHDDRGLVDYLRKSTLRFMRFFVANFQFSSPRGNDPYLQHILISHEEAGTPIKHKNLHDGFSSIIKMEYRHRLKDEKTEHKHQKPVDFIARFLNHYSEPESKVLDLFGGSGSVLISCEKTNRQCRMMELDPKYCDVIVKRWEDFTGKKAKLEEANDATG